VLYWPAAAAEWRGDAATECAADSLAMTILSSERCAQESRHEKSAGELRAILSQAQDEK